MSHISKLVYLLIMGLGAIPQPISGLKQVFLVLSI